MKRVAIAILSMIAIAFVWEAIWGGNWDRAVERSFIVLLIIAGALAGGIK